MYKFLVFFFVMFLPASACAANIAIITRKNILPYEIFIQGYTAAYRGHGLKNHTLKVFSIDPQVKFTDEKLISDVSSFEPNIIIAVGPNSVKFAELCCPNIPLIYSMVINSSGIAATKKINQCGIIMESDIEQRLEVLREFNKNAKRIGAVYNPSESNEQFKELQLAARKKNLILDAVAVTSAKDALPAIEAVIGRVDAYLLLFDKSLLVPQVLEYLFSCSFRSKVPIIGLSEKYTSLGALFSLEYDIKDLGRETWKQTAAFLAGADVCAGLQKPTANLRLVINKKIAEKMGIVIPARMSAEFSFVE